MAEQAGHLRGAWPGREPVIRNDPLDPERDAAEVDGGAGSGGIGVTVIPDSIRDPPSLPIECTVTVIPSP
jgi:hypothetical protein